MSKKTDSDWLDELSRVGCIVCRIHKGVFSPALIHHIRNWHGERTGRNILYALPLCYLHHDAKIEGVSFHENSSLWKKLYGEQEDLMEAAHGLLLAQWANNVHPSKKTLIDKFRKYLEVSGVDIS